MMGTIAALGVLAVLASSRRWAPVLATPLVVTSRFGPRGAITTPDGRVLPPGFHSGIDLRAAVGTPLFSPVDGVVLAVESGSAGRILRIEDADGGRVSLVHLDRIDVARGERVSAGQLVGATGNSGGVAPHLHLEYRPAPWRTSSAVDPAPLLGVS
jgi:murein DD-endopeptidase MepM/ murein hydrolase activator NlpD